MAKYQKKPTIIDAVRFHPAMTVEEMCAELGIPYEVDDTPDGFRFADRSIYITTLNGEVRATVGEWIIKGVNGEFYPCANDIFEKLHEIPARGHELYYIDKGELRTRPASRIIDSQRLELPKPLEVPASEDGQSDAEAFEATLPSPTFEGHMMTGDDMPHSVPTRIGAEVTNGPDDDDHADFYGNGIGLDD